MEFRFEVTSTGNRGSRAQLGQHELVFDMPPKAGGDGRGPGPLAVWLTSAAACMHYFASGVFTKKGLPVEGLAIAIVARQVSEPNNHVDQLRFEITLPEGTDEATRAEVEAAVKRCPVHNTLHTPPPLEVAIV